MMMDVVLPFLIGYFLTRKKGGAAQPSPPAQQPPPQQWPPAQPPAQIPPQQRPPPPSSAPPTSAAKKAVEVWHVKPQYRKSDLTGIAEQTYVQALQSQWPGAWAPVPGPSSAEVSRAQSKLPSWRSGGVDFEGPLTQSGRRAYRYTTHTGAAPTTPTEVSWPSSPPPAAPPAPPPAAPPGAPPGTIPASYPGPAPAPPPATGAKLTIILPPGPKPPVGPGSKNDTVRAVQDFLRWRGFYAGTLDSSYGPQTRAAAEAFQRSVTINPAPNGGWGTKSWLAYDRIVHGV